MIPKIFLLYVSGYFLLHFTGLIPTVHAIFSSQMTVGCGIKGVSTDHCSCCSNALSPDCDVYTASSVFNAVLCGGEV